MNYILIIASLFFGFVEASSQGMFNVKFGKDLSNDFYRSMTYPVSKQDIVYDIEGGYKHGPIELFGNFSHDYAYEGKYSRTGVWVGDIFNGSHQYIPTLTVTEHIKQKLTSWTVGLRYVLPEIHGIKPFISISAGEFTLEEMQVFTSNDTQQNIQSFSLEIDKLTATTMKNSVGLRYFTSQTLFLQAQLDYQLYLDNYNHPTISFNDREMFSARIGIGTQF